MSSLLIVATLVAAVIAYRASVRTGFALVLSTLFIVPGNLALPHTGGVFPIYRVVQVAFLFGLVRRLSRSEIPRSVVLPGRVHAVFVGLLVVLFVNGMAINIVGNRGVDAAFSWMTFVDQFVFFVCALAACRILGPFRVARLIVAFVAVTLAIVTYEKVTGESFSQFVYTTFGSGGRLEATDLLSRGGEQRVQGPFQFALEYGWIAAMLVPLTTAYALRSRRFLPLLVPVCLVITMLWTVSRSAPAGVAAGLLVVVIATFDRRAVGVLVAGAVAAIIVVLVAPSVLDRFSAAEQDSSASRVRRLTIVTDAAADQPYEGLGLAAVSGRGLEGTDSSYSLFYASAGVPALVAYGLVLVTTLATAARGLLHRDRDLRLLAGASVATIIVTVIGDGAHNVFFVPGTSRLFWLVVAIGTAVASQLPTPARRERSPFPYRLFVPAVGLAAGALVLSIVPTHAAATYRFTTVSMLDYSRLLGEPDPLFTGRHLVNTACEAAGQAPVEHAKVQCDDLRDGAGLGYLRIEAGTAEEVQTAAAVVENRIKTAVPLAQLHRRDLKEGRPTWARTAPFWLTASFTSLALLCPRLPRRRKHSRQPIPPDSEARTALPVLLGA